MNFYVEISFFSFFSGSRQEEKSRMWETLTLLMCEDSSTKTMKSPFLTLTFLHSFALFGTVQCSAVRWRAVQCSSSKCSAGQCSSRVVKNKFYRSSSIIFFRFSAIFVQFSVKLLSLSIKIRNKVENIIFTACKWCKLCK